MTVRGKREIAERPVIEHEMNVMYTDVLPKDRVATVGIGIESDIRIDLHSLRMRAEKSFPEVAGNNTARLPPFA